MATFREMLKQFCEDTGRHDLVVNFAGGNYADNGAGVFLNAGQEMLDRRFFRALGQDSTFIATLAAGEYELTIPRARALNNVWVRATSSAGSSKSLLAKKTKDELRDLYLLQFSEVTPGVPTYHARVGETQTLIEGSGPTAADNIYEDLISNQTSPGASILDSFNYYGLTANGRRASYTASHLYASDLDEDGFVSYADLAAQTGSGINSQGLFDDVDTDLDGLISASDLQVYMQSQQTPFTVEKGWVATTPPVFDNGNVELSGFYSYYALKDLLFDLTVNTEGLGEKVTITFDIDFQLDPPPHVGLVIQDVSFLPASFYSQGIPVYNPFVRATWVISEPGTYSFNLPYADACLLRFDSSANITYTLSNIEIVPTSTLSTGPRLDIEGEKLLILPPTDEEVQIEVDGSFYSLPFSLPTDETFWSKTHPYLLCLAAQFKHEIIQRNKAGANELLLRINEELVELNLDEIDAENIDSEFIQIEG